MSKLFCLSKSFAALSLFLLSTNAFALTYTSTTTSTSTATATQPVTLSVKVNGATSTELDVGDPIVVVWKSTNANSATSTISRDGSDPIPWEINSTSGSWTGTAFPESAGHTYTILFNVKDANASTYGARASYIVRVPAKKVDPTDLSSKSSGGVVRFSAAVTATNDSVVSEIDNKVDATPANQAATIVAATQVNDLAANQAATAGAVFCAQGANTHLTNPGDASALFASCQQQFDAAHALKHGEFNPVHSTLDDPASQQALEDFEKNFGVSADEYLSKMLGTNGGASSLADMVKGKISESMLADAMEAAKKAGEEGLMSDPGKSSQVSGGKKGSVTLRDSISRKLNDSQPVLVRKPGSVFFPAKKDIVEPREKFVNLKPSNELNFATKEDENPELTIFDVIHSKYFVLRQRMWR
ncbi:MAG: hypothetical protein ACXWQO_10585 [Bdellovibrionota bacterium]